jgi:putative esterase
MRSASLLLAVAAASVVTTAPASAGSLPRVDSGQRPGPDILYAPPARAPQLQNTGVWRAPPILISGASAYRRGEFVYQDFLYDDHGARGQRDPADPRRKVDETAATPNGSYTYPTDPAYAGNAADLVELRVRPLLEETAFRVTLNTVTDPSLVAFTIAIGGTPGSIHELPHGAGASAPADLFLTVHGHEAELTDAATGQPAGTPEVRVDVVRRQFDVRIEHSAWDPGLGSVRLAAAVGLWDEGNYLAPGPGATATAPGGAGGLATPSALFNVAFRAQEPFQGPDFSVLTDATWWRDRLQAQALSANDISRFSVQVDFGKLGARVDDDMPGQLGGVPQNGPMDRILASRFDLGQGIDFSKSCLPGSLPAGCTGEYLGQLQPYAIYVPRKPQPPGGYGLTLLLHSYGGTYNQYATSRNQSQLGERGEGSIVITPEGRGPDGWYYEYPGADVFEVWSDVARRYTLDPGWTAISGYSMGGYGTFKLATQFPDLFGRASTTVGPSGFFFPSASTRAQLESLRNVPILMWAGQADASVPVSDTQPQADRLDELGYRYEYDLFTSAIHLLPAFNDQYQPVADFLGNARVDRDPPHVTYAYNPTMDFPNAGTRAGHAYWISQVKVRDPAANGGRGVVDVRSEGFGTGDPSPSGKVLGSGQLTGGVLFSLPFSSQAQTWGPAPAAPVGDRLLVRATNVASVKIDRRRARVSCHAKIDVVSDGPIDVTLAGCMRRCKHGSARHGHHASRQAGIASRFAWRIERGERWRRCVSSAQD